MSYLTLNNQINNLLNNEYINKVDIEPSILYSNVCNEYNSTFQNNPLLDNEIIKKKIGLYLLCDKDKFIATIEQLRLICKNDISINDNKIYYNNILYRKINNNYDIPRPYFIKINDRNDFINVQY